MGYTHYLDRPEQIENWDKIITDTKQVYNLVSSLGIDIVDGSAEPDSYPEFSNELIWFNGSNQQILNTTTNEFTITWSNQKKEQFLEVRHLFDRQGSYQALFIPRKYDLEALVNQAMKSKFVKFKMLLNYKLDNPHFRKIVAKITNANFDMPDIDDNGNYETCCQTRYYPYDLLVMCVYLIVKIYDNRCIIASDGEKEDWQLAIAIVEEICQKDSQILSQFLEEDYD